VDGLPAEEGRADRRGGFSGGRGILVVDDEKQIIFVLKEMLEILGYRIFAAGCGQEAVAVYTVKHDEIDLVILDMIMPGMGGGKTFVKLREIDPDVRVILATGYAMHKDIQKVMAEGCDGFLLKPFKLDELSGEIHRVLAREP
jgi:CheY-like chemotaxis protein